MSAFVYFFWKKVFVCIVEKLTLSPELSIGKHFHYSFDFKETTVPPKCDIFWVKTEDYVSYYCMYKITFKEKNFTYYEF